MVHVLWIIVMLILVYLYTTLHVDSPIIITYCLIKCSYKGVEQNGDRWYETENSEFVREGLLMEY